jgi:HTH-type transcriptional regulator/antitoxin HigA
MSIAARSIAARSIAARSNRKPIIGDSYLALILKHPLKAIKTQADYNAASAVLDKLALRDDLDAGQEQYLDALEVLITAYDDRHAPVSPDRRTPLQRLIALLQSSQTTPAQLQSILDSSQSMVSMILSGQRQLSKKAIAKLASHFRIEPGYFL